jgi:uncharacterized RDD family membrane protein YckC
VTQANTPIEIKPLTPVVGLIPKVSLGYAGFWRRGAAAWIDGLIYSTLGGLATLPVVGIQLFFTAINPTNTLLDGLLNTLSIVINLGVWLAYFAWFETRYGGKTPGRRLLGLALTDENGDGVSGRQSVYRQLGKIPSALVLGLGYKIQPFTAKKQTWHDQWTHTVTVVYAERPAWLPWLINGVFTVGCGLLMAMAFMAMQTFSNLSL